METGVVLWAYDYQQYPSQFIEQVRAGVHVNIIPVRSTYDAMNILNSCENLFVTDVVTCFARTEFGRWYADAGLQLIRAVRAYSPTLPICVFDTNRVTDTVRLQNYWTAGQGPARARFDILHDVSSLIKFLNAHIPPPPTSNSARSPDEVVWPKRGDTVTSDQSRMYYTLGKTIGEGSYAVVKECFDFFGQHYVMKIQKPQRAKQSVEEDWKKERNLMLSLNHPNIIQLYDAFVHNNLYFYTLERADGSLADLIKGGGKLPLRDVLLASGQILSGLCHIHKKNIIHRDIQMDNILYRVESGKIVCKISDFGISKQVHAGSSTQLGSTGRGWEIAPELLLFGFTSFQSDIYQLGLIIFFLAKGFPIFNEQQDGHYVEVVKSGVFMGKAQSALEGHFGVTLAKFLHVDMSKRYTTSYEAWQDLSMCFSMCKGTEASAFAVPQGFDVTAAVLNRSGLTLPISASTD